MTQQQAPEREYYKVPEDEWYAHLSNLAVQARKIENERGRFGAILSICNGGTQVGTYLSNFMDIELHGTVTIKSYTPTHDQKRLRMPIKPPAAIIRLLKEGGRLLIADDLVDSGKTLWYLIRFLSRKQVTGIPVEQLLRQIALVAVYAKPRALDSKLPYAYAHMVENHVWLIFKWEPEYWE